MRSYIYGVWPDAFAITYVSYVSTYYDSYTSTYNVDSYDILDLYMGTHVANDPLIVVMASLEQDVFRFEDWTYNLTYSGFKEEWTYDDGLYDVLQTESSETYASYMEEYMPEHDLSYIGQVSYYMKTDYSNIRSIQWV